MNLGWERVSGMVIIVGSVLFLVAAFHPISMRVFPEQSATRRLEAIQASPTAWSVTQILFGLGSLLTAIGVALLASGSGTRLALLGWLSVAVLVVAVLLWLWHLYGRAADPTAFVQGRQPAWPVLAYLLLTEVGLAILGFALLNTDLPIWVGWMVIGSMALLFVLTLIFRDMPPLMFYLVTLVAGVALLVTQSGRA